MLFGSYLNSSEHLVVSLTITIIFVRNSFKYLQMLQSTFSPLCFLFVQMGILDILQFMIHCGRRIKKCVLSTFSEAWCKLKCIQSVGMKAFTFVGIGKKNHFRGHYLFSIMYFFSSCLRIEFFFRSLKLLGN